MATSEPAATPPTPQRIPRPADARPGQPAPWEGLAPLARRSLGVARVLDALERAGQRADSPPDERWDTTNRKVLDTDTPIAGARLAAVLVALFEEHDEARVLLTRRSSSLRSHRGEVSFPGGRLDPGEDAVAAATREALEEVGLDPSAGTVVGWLHPVVTVASGSLIIPVVSVLGARPVLVPNPDEVERAFDVALADLVVDGVFHEERWRLPSHPAPGSPDGSFPAWFFQVAGETVWGATARVLMELVTLTLGLAPTPS